MNSEDLNECFLYVKDLILKCGDILKEGYKDCGEIHRKNHAMDFVTIYDRKIENFLIDGIKERYPEHLFIAEEQTADSKQSIVLTAQPTWIIDPIDGTVNFVKKIPFVCISVALAVNNDLVIGFLYNPITDEFFSAQKNCGAYLNDERIEVSKIEELKGSNIALGLGMSRAPFFRPLLIERLKIFFEKSAQIHSFGSAALELGYIAKGSCDAFVTEHLKPWDIAAGAMIIIEAGGVVIDINGGKFDVLKPNIIAASNMKIASEIKAALDEVNEKLEAEGKSPGTLYMKWTKEGGELKNLFS